MWLGMCILPWHYFSHRVCQIFGRGHWSKPGEQARIGIKGLGQFISNRVYVMLSVQPAICKLSRLLSIGHSWPWRQDHFQKCSCSSTPTPTLPHIHPHTHAQPASIQWAMKQTFIFCLCTSFFISDKPRTSPCSPHLAVWRPSWGRVTCSLLAWQSASLSRQAASICWPLTANRLDWKRFTPEDDFVCMFPKQTHYDNCRWWVQPC